MCRIRAASDAGVDQTSYTEGGRMRFPMRFLGIGDILLGACLIGGLGDLLEKRFRIDPVTRGDPGL
jgi:hypothetical protein